MRSASKQQQKNGPGSRLIWNGSRLTRSAPGGGEVVEHSRDRRAAGMIGARAPITAAHGGPCPSSHRHRTSK